MTSGDVEGLKVGIAKLLSGVETAFVTSLVGIGCAIVYSVAHHWLMKNFQSKVQTLSDKLDEIFPRRSAENWLQSLDTTAAKNFSESQSQTSMLHELNATAAESFAESQGQTSILQSLNATSAKSLNESLEQTTVLKNIGEQVADAIHKALDLAGPKDTVLICGKGHETYQEICGVRRDYDDRIVVRDYLRLK